MPMIDGFKEGWIDFENGEASSSKGDTNIESVLHPLVRARNVHRFIFLWMAFDWKRVTNRLSPQTPRFCEPKTMESHP